MADSTTNIDQISSTQANKELTANALFDSASPIMLWSRHASASAGLTWGYYGGRFVDSTGAAHAIANGTITLSASTTTYIFADNVTGAVSSNTTGFPAGKVPLYSVVTGASNVSSWLDYRSYQPSATGGSGGGGGAASMNVAGGAVQTAAYTFVSSDKGNCLVMNSASAVSQALTSMSAGWWASLNNIGAGTTTLTVPSGASLDGVVNGTLAVPTNTGVTFFTDGTNYYTVRGLASGGSGSSTLAGLSDVALSSPTAGQVLTYNGSKWTNQTPSGGGGGAAAGAMVPISRQVLSAAQTSVTISPPSSGYSRLIVKIVGRSAAAGTNTSSSVQVNFNSDTAKHNAVFLQQNGSTTISGFVPSTNGANAYVGDLPQNGVPSGFVGVIEYTVDEYTSTTMTKNGSSKNYFARNNAGSSTVQAIVGTVYSGLSAITSMVFTAGSSGTDQFAAGTIFAVYGVTDNATGNTIPPFGTTDTAPPTLSAFTWTNQGSTATAVQGPAGNVSIADPTSSSNNLRILTKVAPGTPYSIVARFRGTLGNSGIAGLCWTDSSGKVIVAATQPYVNTGSSNTVTPQFCIGYWNSPTSWNSNPFSVSLTTSDIWIKIRDDGTNLAASISSDGITFIQLWTASRTAFMTSGPANVGFFVAPNGSYVQAALMSWLQGT